MEYDVRQALIQLLYALAKLATTVEMSVSEDLARKRRS